jgi:hypothetical protein
MAVSSQSGYCLLRIADLLKSGLKAILGILYEIQCVFGHCVSSL